MKRKVSGGAGAALALVLVLAGGLSAQDQKETSPVTSAPALRLSGYTQARYAINDFGPDGFQLYRARFGLEGEIFRNIRYKVTFEAARTPQLLDAQIDFTLVKNGYLRVGQFKIPFSQENLLSAADLETINLSQVVNKLVPGRDNGSNGRDIGALADYRFGRWEGMGGLFNGSGINKADPDEKKDFALRATWGSPSSLRVGASVYLGHTIPVVADSPILKRNRYGLEATWTCSDFLVKAEFVYGQDGDLSADGFYVLGGYFLLPKKVQVVARCDFYDKDLDVAGSANTILLAGVNWFFTSRTKLQVNLELAKPAGQSLDFSALLAQFQVGF
jgi:phosphate-selective porin